MWQKNNNIMHMVEGNRHTYDMLLKIDISEINIIAAGIDDSV